MKFNKNLIILIVILFVLGLTYFIYLKKENQNIYYKNNSQITNIVIDQKVLYASFKTEASSTSISNLEKTIILLSKDLENKYDIKIGLKIHAFLSEYEKQVPNYNSTEILEIQNLLLNKYGPCWGIPDGDCRE